MKLRRFEIALLAALAVTLLFSASLARAQEDAAGELIRLHVVANSDSDSDQALKLQVRDAVLASLEPVLTDAQSRGDGLRILRENLAVAESAARRVLDCSGFDCTVTVTLEREVFPTRVYDTFTLPAGEYETLRVVIGSGGGRNWWCVIYPPLCKDSATYEIARDKLTARSARLIAADDSDVTVVKFRTLEIIAKVKKLLRVFDLDKSS